MSDPLASLPWSNNSDRKPMISRRDFTNVASVAAGCLFLSSDGGSQETRALVSGNPATAGRLAAVADLTHDAQRLTTSGGFATYLY
jgi:hypothetical protein